MIYSNQEMFRCQWYGNIEITIKIIVYLLGKQTANREKWFTATAFLKNFESSDIPNLFCMHNHFYFA